ncbi:MAG: hypothetical protein EON96_04600 [Caulobacteraceae bacterium]|nr:MAG: hypothetical protein EON96_04600 [Caulobacteraceae bacterium]
MSVTILDSRAYSLIATYAQTRAVSLSPGQTPEGLAQSLYAANLEAFRGCYPQFDAVLPLLRLTWLNAADDAEVLEAVEMWRYNVEEPEDQDLKQDLEAVVAHIEQDHG